MKDKELKECKKVSIRIAKQLLYKEEVVYKIRKAKSTEEIYRIMCTARKEINDGQDK